MVAAGSRHQSWRGRASDVTRYHVREVVARESSRDISGEGWTGTRGEDPSWTRDIDEICVEDMPIGIG